MKLYCKKSSPVLVGFATSHSGDVALCVYDTQYILGNTRVAL